MEELLRMPFMGTRVEEFGKRFISCILIAVCGFCLYADMNSFVGNRNKLSKVITVGARETDVLEQFCLAEFCIGLDRVPEEHLLNFTSVTLPERIIIPEEPVARRHNRNASEERLAATTGYPMVSEECPAAVGNVIEAVPTADVVAVTDTVTEKPAEDTGLAVAELSVDADEERVIAGFVYDADGYIVDCTDAVDVTDGLLVLPFTGECIGIRSGALDRLGDKVIEIYIPESIHEIETGTFDCLSSLLFIETAEGHSYFFTSEEDGCLYTITGEQVASPLGWQAMLE